MKDYAYEHLKLTMSDRAATVIQALIRGHAARVHHEKLKVRYLIFYSYENIEILLIYTQFTYSAAIKCLLSAMCSCIAYLQFR